MALNFGVGPSIVEWDSWSGKSYTCGPCYERTLTATASTVTTRSVSARDVPRGALCAMCKMDLGGQKDNA